MEQVETLKALVIGATGAVGRELIQELVKSPNWSEVSVVVRRKLDEWDQFSETEKAKLKIHLHEDLDCLQDLSKWDFSGYSTLFCCLGSLRKHGKETFIKVDRTYPSYAGKLAVHFKIPHYSLVSAVGASSSSCLFYSKTKGQTEDDMRALNFPHLTIMRPGLLLDRQNDERFVEKVMKVLPGPKVPTKDASKALRIDAELQHKSPHSQKVVIYENSNIKKLVETGKYPEKLGS